MRKRFIITLFTLLCMAGSINAQTQTGNKMLGGGVMYSSTSNKAESIEQSDFSFTPQWGYFVADNVLIGLRAQIGRERYERFVHTNKTFSWGIGAFARYYKFLSDDKFAFFAQAGFDFNASKTSTTDITVSNIKSTSVAFHVAPGMAYFFNTHWALDLYIRGLTFTSTDPNKIANLNRTNEIVFDLNSLTPNLGIRYHF